MGNQYIDAIWLIPAIVFSASVCLAFKLGVEVGRDRQKREDKSRRRHPSTRNRYGYETEYPSNVTRFK